MIIFLGVGLWSGWATSYNSLVATRFVGGIAAGVIEAMGPFIVTETFHEDHLGREMVTYVSFLTGGFVIRPILPGIIATHLGSWRWFFWVMSVVIGVNLFFAFFLLPETSFAGEWETDHQSASESIEDSEKAVGTSISVDQFSQSKLQLSKGRSFFLPWKMADITRPSNNRFGFFPVQIALFPMILIPSVLISSILFRLTIAYTVIYAILPANIFGAPPHLWTAQNIGLLPISSLIGLSIGIPFGGSFADKLSQRQAKRPNGNHSPRSRLPLVLVGFLITPTGFIVSGYCLRPSHFSWIGFAVGWGLLSFGLTSSANITTRYCVDTFQNKSGHIGILINVLKNCIGFEVSFATVPWYMAQGPVKRARYKGWLAVGELFVCRCALLLP